MKLAFCTFLFCFTAVFAFAGTCTITTIDNRTFIWSDCFDTGSHYCSRKKGPDAAEEGILLSCIPKSIVLSIAENPDGGPETPATKNNITDIFMKQEQMAVESAIEKLREKLKKQEKQNANQ
jgi:hypothetical protein